MDRPFKMKLKHGYCQYPDCNLDLGMVHIAQKYCQPHRILKLKLNAQIFRREHYKSKYHREKIVSREWRNPRPLPKGLKEGMPCPGNGNGWCGAIVRRERAMDTGGYTTPFFDYVCGTHRFSDPKKEGVKIDGRSK